VARPHPANAMHGSMLPVIKKFDKKEQADPVPPLVHGDVEQAYIVDIAIDPGDDRSGDSSDKLENDCHTKRNSCFLVGKFKTFLSI